MFRFRHLGSILLAAIGGPAARLRYAVLLSEIEAHKDAFPHFARAAQAGLPAAQFRLGRCYLLGHGVPRCQIAALRWLKCAATSGDVAAQSLLASLALQGICDTMSDGLFDISGSRCGGVPNYHKALHWAERAASVGSPEALAVLGHIRTAGPEDLRDLVEGDRSYRRSAEAGCAQGQLGWALALLRDHIMETASEARTLLESAAAAGLPSAHYMLGVLAESGASGTTDFVAAAKHYQAGAELGQRSAQLRYGMALLAGRGLRQDILEGETWLRRAALAGEAQAAAMVGDLYVRTGELPPNHAEAAIWFRRAAEAGHEGAARALAQLQLRGVDWQEAIPWLRTAAARGDADARAELARLALTRQLHEVDQQAGFAWFKEMAEAGDPVAAFNLGLCLAEAIGAPVDGVAAMIWFRRAAEQGHSGAQLMLGRYLAHGVGGPPDTQQAAHWLQRARDQGMPSAELELATLS
jgi:uncharacterized protein